MPVISSPTRQAQDREVASGTRSSRILVWISLALITILAAYLQLHNISAKSFWLDEGSSITMARLDWFNFLRILWRREMNMVLYYLLLRGWLHLGDSVAWIRGLSVIFATAAVPGIFLLGRKMQGIGLGLISALLLSVNAFQVRYAQEARSYSLLVLLVIASTYFFISAIDSNSPRDWKWYIVASSLAVYSQFFAVLVVVAHWIALWVLFRTKSAELAPDIRKQFRRAAKLIALWTLPIWLFIVTTGAGPIAWIRRPGVNDIVGLLKKLSGNADTALFVIYSACVLLALVQGALSPRKQLPGSRSYIVLACWFIVPLLIVLVASVIRPVFAPRYMMICLPAWIMLAAAGANSIRPRFLVPVALALFVWLGIIGVRSYYRADFDIGRNDVRSATIYILEHAEPSDGVVFYTLSARFPYDYYAAHSASQNKPDILWPGNNSGVAWRDFMGVPSAARVPQFASGHERIWLVTTPMPPNDPKFTAFEAALNQSYRLTVTQDFPFIRVMLFER